VSRLYGGSLSSWAQFRSSELYNREAVEHADTQGVWIVSARLHSACVIEKALKSMRLRRVLLVVQLLAFLVSYNSFAGCLGNLGHLDLSNTRGSKSPSRSPRPNAAPAYDSEEQTISPSTKALPSSSTSRRSP